jgi:hypothetical protein
MEKSKIIDGSIVFDFQRMVVGDTELSGGEFDASLIDGTGFVQTQDENVENEVELQVNFKPL